MGKWWGNNLLIKAQDDVDILAFDKTGKKVLLCECKFRNKPMPMEEYDDLVMAAEMFKNAEEKYLMFFSKSGFTESVKERAAREMRCFLQSKTCIRVFFRPALRSIKNEQKKLSEK